jgi:hypothetical protein
MAEPELEAAWRAEFRRIREAQAPHSGQAVLEGAVAAFHWTKLKFDDFMRSTLTTISSGQSSVLSLL